MVQYKMIARDVDSSPIEYRTWVRDGYPDYEAQYYTGPKGGDNPLMDVEVYLIPDGYVVDFNLPNPTSWKTTYCQLPEKIDSSQLAIIDGYIYMFGGKITDKIYRAHESRPTDWVDTGATLPTSLYASQLSIIDGYIYLFGGNNGVATDTIYSASVSDPLTWTNHGSLLPRQLYYSQCVVTGNDGYVCLLGGYSSSGPTDIVCYAFVSDPLTWYTHSQSLLFTLYGASSAVIDNTIYLFGGMQSDSFFRPRKTILYASVDDLFANPPVPAWYYSETLPYENAFGQFMTVGNSGYLFAIDKERSTNIELITDGYSSYYQQYDTGDETYNTKIFTCDLSDPLTWTKSSSEIPYEVYQSQLAVICDRIFLFGGNSSSMILASNPTVHYKFYSADTVAYGLITRTQYQAATNKEELSLILGFPYWKTNYTTNL